MEERSKEQSTLLLNGQQGPLQNLLYLYYVLGPKGQVVAGITKSKAK